MKTRRIPLLVGIVLLAAMAFVGLASACDYGCTPGYWKNHPENWQCPNVGPDEVMDPPYADLDGDGDLDTFMDALNYKGGSGDAGAERILLRAGVAAYLNACAFDYPYDFSDDSDFFDYLGDPVGQRQGMLDLAGYFDYYNNAGCPF